MDEFAQLSSAKQICWQIRQTLIPPIFYHLRYNDKVNKCKHLLQCIPFVLLLIKSKIELLDILSFLAIFVW